MTRGGSFWDSCESMDGSGRNAEPLDQCVGELAVSSIQGSPAWYSYLEESQDLCLPSTEQKSPGGPDKPCCMEMQKVFATVNRKYERLQVNHGIAKNTIRALKNKRIRLNNFVE